MRLTANERWAIGAIALATLIACSPNSPAPDKPVLPFPNKPTLSSGSIVDTTAPRRAAPS